ncbi:PspC domain-containing protein [Exiguobacterium aestuarii]|uniref:PspC domain-containing protein n=1 Tax=Exiguobacterium aestuarii TaxID=273527 RepID=A0ABW2PNW0_9BACL|nr:MULTISPECIES: PspC domain-containing protein [Exiguobacterium]MCT4786920.1 PspC domain-containing protein [Exiguobacterium aestuarii]
MQRTLRKSATDRSIAGVCGGIAEYVNISSFEIRLLFVFLPANFLIYILLANLMKDEPHYL